MGAFKFRGAFNALSRLDAAGPRARRDRILLGQPCAGGCAGGAHPRDLGHHRHAARRAGSQAAGDPRLRRPGGDLRPLPRESRGDRAAARRGQRRDAHPAVRSSRRHRRDKARRRAELIEETGPLDCLFVCLGGGGLLSGSLLAARAHGAGLQGLRRRARGGQRRTIVAAARIDRADRGAENDRRRGANAELGAAYHSRSSAATSRTS